jgi:tetratricopeptide (TPR) repeat protein
MLVVMASCSTKKNKWANRTFHNITARFNGYFNGNETNKEVEAMLKTAHIDNYYKVIPVYQTGTLEDSKTVLPLTDKAIKKASVVITRHSMMIRGKEYAKYIDDCYLLIGKSMFYKRDYYASLEMFAYVARNPVKNNKKDPIQHLANIWLCRAYSELGMYSDARLAIDRSLNDKTLPKKAESAVYMALLDFYLKQNKFPEAIETVDKALKATTKKKRRTRLLFIQGQLLQKEGKLKEASESYSKVLKSNPSYEMAFYSQINIARCFDAENKNSREIRELLTRMLNDPKNFDFNDQIYYVLGELEQKEGNEEKAIDEYNTSVRVSTTNTNQKGMSHLAIAEIHFSNRRYRPSAAYYDSAITSLNKDYPNYKQIETKKKSLDELISKYLVIERYDSLLRLSRMSSDELDKAVMAIIAKEEEDRKKQKEKEALALALANSGGGGGFGNQGTPGGQQVGSGNGLWYFYNPSTKGFGFSEFRKIWGERKLEDNWRRKNKQTVLPVAEEKIDSTQLDPSGKPIVMTREDSIAAAKKRLLADLPKDDEQKQAFADSVMEAFYDIGLIYKERLKDLGAAAETYEEFLQKYPNSKNESTIYYQLYRIYLAMPDAPKAEKYKSLILSKFPDSDYALLISDPESFKKENLTQEAANKFYEETYRLYKARQFTEALARCKTAESKYESNELSARFALLKALIIGNLKDVTAFRESLQNVIATYSTDTVKVKAEQLLKSLDRIQGISPKDTVQAKPTFVYKSDTLHYYVILIENKTMNLNDFKVKLSNFNSKYFSLKDLSVQSRLLGTNYQVITIPKFENRKEGMEYVALINDDDEVFRDMDMQMLETFLISSSNYNLLMKDANVSEYLDFYKRVYE